MWSSEECAASRNDAADMGVFRAFSETPVVLGMCPFGTVWFVSPGDVCTMAASEKIAPVVEPV